MYVFLKNVHDSERKISIEKNTNPNLRIRYILKRKWEKLKEKLKIFGIEKIRD